jgi:hypothetical protein
VTTPGKPENVRTPPHQTRAAGSAGPWQRMPHKTAPADPATYRKHQPWSELIRSTLTGICGGLSRPGCRAELSGMAETRM